MSSDAATYALLNGEDREMIHHKEFYKQKWENTIKSKCRAKYININRQVMCRISDSSCSFGDSGEDCHVMLCQQRLVNF